MAWVERMIRFGFVGILGMLIDFGVTWLCKEKLKFNKFLANAIGFTLAVTHNYVLHRIWTFESTNPKIAQQFGLFVVISIIGLVLNTGILFLLHEKFKLPFYASKLGAIAMVFVWNFTANSLFTFSSAL